MQIYKLYVALSQIFSPWRHPVAHLLYNYGDPLLRVARPSLPPCSRSHRSSDEMTDKLSLGQDLIVLLSHAVMDLLLCKSPHLTLVVQFCHIPAHWAGPNGLWLPSTGWWTVLQLTRLKNEAPNRYWIHLLQIEVDLFGMESNKLDMPWSPRLLPAPLLSGVLALAQRFVESPRYIGHSFRSD